MTTLIIDSSAGCATAVLADGPNVLSAYSVRGSTLSILHHAIHAVHLDYGGSLSQLERIAVVQGPGSWTGLHNCVTTAKTIAQVLEIPLIPLSMLEALATSFDYFEGTVCAMLDAKHGAVYSAAYDCAAGAIVGQSLADRKRTIDELLEGLAGSIGPMLLVGGSATLHVAELSKRLSRALTASEVDYPHPAAFARLAAKRTSAGLIGDALFGLAPDYMQEDFTAKPRKDVECSS